MAETINRAQMAEDLSNKLFAEFLWQKTGPMNENWPCEQQDSHNTKSHPTDVVFYYDEPYSTVRRYIQCDLKSYSKDSIKRNAVKEAILSLADQVSCAGVSEVWQKRYTHSSSTFDVSGLLFVYNHDKQFHKSFDALISDIRPEDIKLPRKSRLYVLGPDEINWLQRVARELQQMRGDEDEAKRLPPRERCAFYYPQLVRNTVVRSERARAATMEMLKSPWIILEHFDEEEARQGFVIFHRRKTTIEGLMYLLDYLRRHELIVNKTRIDIKVQPDDSEASTNLQKAIQEYVSSIPGENQDTDFAKRLSKIKISHVPEILASYSTMDMGMSYAG
ncbi:hypothetical protein E0H72_11600 [Rhizobium leguminosarum bv. viciae]|uniref:hypothetical protein n=1 Tax=Rhizobium leguminosarum TaxID=384 RepID=UPI00103FA2B7|nr:hypothetical protein [Rhizobium leguminosarum]TCA43556.1 hypothetical protein E0H72_11600 [Rhizobium leguminosarum bv. viciae]